MGKLPSIHLYPGDWLRDQVSGCSAAAQGIWLRVMFIMHDSERYGYLCQNGKPMPFDQAARRCGVSLQEFSDAFEELKAAGVPSFTDDGIAYSRRMVRDAKDRATTNKRVIRFRNGSVTPVKRSCNALVTGDVTPMYEDEDDNENDNEVDGEVEFEKSCSLYPKPERSRYTQEAYFSAIGGIRKRTGKNDREAIDWLNSRIAAYSSTAFPCGFKKFLEERIFDQPESAWIQKKSGKYANNMEIAAKAIEEMQ
jgi:hypothetical protein